MAVPTLIYCAAGNKRMAQIAIDAGFEYGARLPDTVYFDLYFADQEWKEPSRDGYMAAIAQHRPYMATVLDLERPDQMSEVLSWAEEAAAHVEVVVIIPKYSGAIAALPRRIDGKEVRLGYSVPTRYGGTEVPVWEFVGWPVHLLGGSPHRQMEIARYVRIASADGNYALKAATQWAGVWMPGNAQYAANRWFPTLHEMGLDSVHDAPYVAFEMSCRNIINAWKTL